MDALQENRLYFGREELSDMDKYNECIIMTRLRTMWGLDIKRLETGVRRLLEPGKTQVTCLEGKRTFREIENNIIRLSPRGWLVSDGIFSELFI